MTQQVFVLGGAQTDFAVNWSRACDAGGPAEPLQAMLADAVAGALADADVPAADIGTAHVGNLAAELFTGQAHLGALVTTLGSIAELAAMAEIEAGRYDGALVTGLDRGHLRTSPRPTGRTRRRTRWPRRGTGPRW